MLAEAWDHARCSGNCTLIILEFMILDFEVFLQNRQTPTIKSSNTDHFAYLGAPGVLKTARHVFSIGKAPGYNIFLIVFAHI